MLSRKQLTESLIYHLHATSKRVQFFQHSDGINFENEKHRSEIKLTGRRATWYWYNGNNFFPRFFWIPDDHNEAKKLERVEFWTDFRVDQRYLYEEISDPRKNQRKKKWKFSPRAGRLTEMHR